MHERHVSERDVLTGADTCARPGEPSLDAAGGWRLTPQAASGAWAAAGRPRQGTALCLSGGGFRAALLHAGALLRLEELGVLAQVDVVTGVSGGSLAATALAGAGLLPVGDRVPGLRERVVEPLLALAGEDIRTRAGLRALLPWDSGVEALGRRIARADPVWRTPFADLGPWPRLVVAATDLTRGEVWTTSGPSPDGGAARWGSASAGYRPVPRSEVLGLAAATSSAVPPVLTARSVPVPGMRAAVLADGAVFDNAGLEPVWKTHRVLLVSDGGPVFRARTERTVLGRLLRAAEVQGRSSALTRQRWLTDLGRAGVVDSASWSLADPARDGGYPADVVRLLGDVRTDYDAFSAGERGALLNHGYALADASVRAEQPALARLDAPPAPPAPAWSDPDRARAALAGSDRLVLLGRGRG